MDYSKVIRIALSEDIGHGDITTNAIVPKNKTAKAVIRLKEAGIICGTEIACEVFRQVDRGIKFLPKCRDGQLVKKGTIIAELSGPARGILMGERVALNFLQHLSGIATLTASFAARVKGQGARILDTRKTIPGLRALEKYAVRCGGGVNHRMGLYDAILIKDNHIKIAGGVKKAVEGIRRQRKEVEVETKNLAEVKETIQAGVGRVLLDNMEIKSLRQAVKLCKAAGVKTEASGGVNLQNVAAIARTGVDYISVGALTHSAKALDINLKVI
ncbi:MAG: carboxylating nicotinate-nucleotide diphosphorylase [Candidatus Margulisbacteria bacterium]|nr:carboxylating nicotinate-nucleotide diphosphorylase [Candidatus Margulisiibacteriota bacterium]